LRRQVTAALYLAPNMSLLADVIAGVKFEDGIKKIAA
jgi:hypothetical protein